MGWFRNLFLGVREKKEARDGKQRLLSGLQRMVCVEEDFFAPSEIKEIVALIKDMLKKSSKEEKAEQADIVISMGVGNCQTVATYQDGSCLMTATTYLYFKAKDGTLLMSAMWPGKYGTPPPQIFRMLNERPKQIYVGIPKEFVITYMRGILKEAGVYKS